MDDELLMMQKVNKLMFAEKITYDKNNFAGISLWNNEYENCLFNQCDFSNADLYRTKFIDCQFVNCNLSLLKVSETIFRDTKFMGCKMIGILFYDCNKLGLSVSFDTCTLNHSSFYGTKIRKTIFANSSLQEVDFTDCDLTGAVISHCDLMNAKFENTNLETADLRTSFHYNINPVNNKIRKAKFSVSSIEGLLQYHDIIIDQTS